MLGLAAAGLVLRAWQRASGDTQGKRLSSPPLLALGRVGEKSPSGALAGAGCADSAWRVATPRSRSPGGKPQDSLVGMFGWRNAFGEKPRLTPRRRMLKIGLKRGRPGNRLPYQIRKRDFWYYQRSHHYYRNSLMKRLQFRTDGTIWRMQCNSRKRNTRNTAQRRRLKKMVRLHPQWFKKVGNMMGEKIPNRRPDLHVMKRMPMQAMGRTKSGKPKGWRLSDRVGVRIWTTRTTPVSKPVTRTRIKEMKVIEWGPDD